MLNRYKIRKYMVTKIVMEKITDIKHTLYHINKINKTKRMKQYLSLEGERAEEQNRKNE